MTNIYKREPVVHKLPAGWSNIDGIKHTNINEIKGLQHIDNALAANQAGTYDCKNVYQDESGNLTLRPALRHLTDLGTEKIYGLYECINGAVIIYTDHFDVYGINNEFITTMPISSVNLTVQDFNGVTYILFCNNKLMFYAFDGKTVEPVNPDIPLNSAEEPVSRLYNLLSGNIRIGKVAYYPPILNTDAFTDWVDNTTEYTERDVRTVYISESGNIVLFVLNSAIVKYERAGDYYIPRVFELDNAIPDDARIICEDDAVHYAGPASTLFWHGHIKLGANDVEENVFIVNYEPTIIYSEIIIVPGFNNDAHMAIKGRGYDDDFNTIHILSFLESTLKISRDMRNFSQTEEGEYGLLNLTASGNALALVYTYVVTANDYRHIMAFNLFDGGRRSSTWEDREITVWATKNSINYVWTSGNASSGYIPSVHTTTAWSTPFSETLVGKALTSEPTYTPQYNLLRIGHDDSEYLYDLSAQTLYEYPGAIKPIVALNQYSTVVVTSSDSGYIIKSRALASQYQLLPRTISDSFPLVSQIEDEVLTSFYLDNIHWFVTKHRIFGTGVVDEQFSIKYWDPMKYFHFDEELTAAIRISDSSFWVFHNNGAYLIYKSTSQIYDNTVNDYIDVITWLCTSTAKSKGCDFDNAVLTLPVTSYVACVTSDDISSVQMRENVQTDDRILVPMTTEIQQFISALLNNTENIITGTYKYNALFFLNRVAKNDTTPVMVYNTVTNSWWYWELPLNSVVQTVVTETGIEILGAYHKDGIDHYAVYDLYEEYYDYIQGGLTWKLYADRVDANDPVKIEWFWQSALLHFNTTDYKKQLLFTTFSLSEKTDASINFDYNFGIYDDEYSERHWSEINQAVIHAKSYSCKNIIARYMYLQLHLKNPDDNSFESLTKPKISAITFKYRILPGGLL